MSSALENKDYEFVQAVRRALDESAASLPANTADRLAAARRTALARKKKAAEPVLVRVPTLAPAGMPAGYGSPRRRSRLARLAIAWPLAAIVAGLFAIAWFEDHQRTAELADIDAAMLSDELPLNAYLDHGFNAYLSHSH
jgi:hypothetical protein